MKDKILETIMPIFTIPIFIVGYMVVVIASILSYPIFRISKEDLIRFELPVKVKAIRVGDFFRNPIESIVGNELLFFSKEPYRLFVSTKEIEVFPKELYHERFSHSVKHTQTIVATFETKKLRFVNGYLPAKLIGFKIIDEIPEVSK